MTPRDRRAVQMGAVVAIVAAVAFRGIPWAIRAATARWAELEAQAALLARMESEVAGAARLEDSAAVIKSALARLPAKLLSGRTETEAATDLAGLLSRESTVRQIRLDRTDVVADSTRAGWLRRITLSAMLEGDTRGIIGLLAGLTTGSPVVVVQQARVFGAGSDLEPKGPEALRLELTLQGWYLGDQRVQ